MSMWIDPQYMIDWARYEQTGYWPDSMYTPTGEDLQDPDHHEIAALVCEQYAVDNAKRREARMQSEINALRRVLEENGIEWSEEI